MLNTLHQQQTQLISSDQHLRQQYTDVKQQLQQRNSNATSNKRQNQTETVERFNAGQLVERRTTNTATEATRTKTQQIVSQSTSNSTRSVDVKQTLTAISSNIVETHQSTQSHNVGNLEFNQKPFGVGPVVWLSWDSAYMGLSYRTYTIPSIDVGIDVVIGTNLQPQLAAGLMLSKEMAPRLNLGIVSFGNINTQQLSTGVGLSYLF